VLDLQHDLPTGVSGRDVRQRVPGLRQRKRRLDLRTQLAGIHQASQFFPPGPVGVRGERLARDAALKLNGRIAQRYEGSSD
jgi:hypothetical protein